MLIPDHETEVDFLNCEVIARAVTEILKENRDRPLTVGIHGDWGAGKSSILKMIECTLVDDESVAVLWFNGWTFEGFDDAKTIFIESIVTELSRLYPKHKKVKVAAKKLLHRVNWLKVARHGSNLAVNLTTGAFSPDQIKTVFKTLTSTKEEVKELDSESIAQRLTDISDLLKPSGEQENLPETIHAFREEFQEMLNEAEIDKLVVLIDDLDRCLPSTAIETLEAIRLFLFVPKTAFIIGADETMIEYAVRQHFPDLPQTSISLSYAKNYLEKLIQIPFRIPALGIQETRVYISLLLVQSLVGGNHDGFKALLKKAKTNLNKPWLDVNITQTDLLDVDGNQQDKLGAVHILVQQIAPILTEGTKGNPRQVKRFLNTLFVRQIIARARGFGSLMKQPILAKLMLAERFQPDFYDEVSSQVMGSTDGKSVKLESIEQEVMSNKEIKDRKSTKAKSKNISDDEDSWLDREWIQRWVAIEPKIGGVDLRPYIFVARDKRLLASVGTTDVLESLIKSLLGKQLEVRTVEQDVKELSQSDARIVFSKLCERIVLVDDMKKEPPGMAGIAVLAKHHKAFQSELVSFLGGLEPISIGAWVVRGWNETITESRAGQELQSLFEKWARQDNNKILSKAASIALNSIPQEAK